MEEETTEGESMDRETTEQETMAQEMMEEETREDKSIAQGPFESIFNIFIPEFLPVPEFLPEYSLSSLTLDEQNTQLLQKDWLTTGVVEEIEALFPSSSKIKADNDNKRDPIEFQHKISKLFPPGRIFASFKQLDQAADMFLGAWAVKKTTHSKSIPCAYSSAHDKKYRKHGNLLKR
jgi:hypothetical protein